MHMACKHDRTPISVRIDSVDHCASLHTASDLITAAFEI